MHIGVAVVYYAHTVVGYAHAQPQPQNCYDSNYIAIFLGKIYPRANKAIKVFLVVIIQ